MLIPQLLRDTLEPERLWTSNLNTQLLWTSNLNTQLRQLLFSRLPGTLRETGINAARSGLRCALETLANAARSELRCGLETLAKDCVARHATKRLEQNQMVSGDISDGDSADSMLSWVNEDEIRGITDL